METGKAAAYLRDTEVVVWTPRLTTGRPLSFAPLASLGDVVSIYTARTSTGCTLCRSCSAAFPVGGGDTGLRGARPREAVHARR